MGRKLDWKTIFVSAVVSTLVAYPVTKALDAWQFKTGAPTKIALTEEFGDSYAGGCCSTKVGNTGWIDTGYFDTSSPSYDYSVPDESNKILSR